MHAAGVTPGSEGFCPLPVELVDAYEHALAGFWSTVHDHSEDGALNMGACIKQPLWGYK